MPVKVVHPDSEESGMHLFARTHHHLLLVEDKQDLKIGSFKFSIFIGEISITPFIFQIFNYTCDLTIYPNLFYYFTFVTETYYNTV